MENLLQKLKETVSYLEDRTDNYKPEVGIILGTGLGNLSDEIEAHATIPYEDIPHFPVSTVKSHGGNLIFGTLNGKRVVAMQGRFHHYEGYTMQQVVYPVRTMKLLGIDLLCISNASGGLNAKQSTGSLMIINDHINLMPENPLRGKNYDELGPRFPDMMKTYDKALVAKGMEIAKANGIDCMEGVYCGVPGPNLETPAEYKYINIIGGDAVGMSTVPEALAAKHMELKIFAISAITDMGYPPEAIQETSLEDVIAAAGEAEPKMTLIIKELIGQL